MTNVILDFSDLSSGTIVGSQLSASGVTISSASSSTPPMIFDTANPTGDDGDLASASFGNVLILSEDGDGSDPDSASGGGTVIFTFDSAADVNSLSVLDFEEGGEIRC